MTQKTIFITIARSYIIRNILRSGCLDLLKKSGHRIIIFLGAEQVPQYLRDEFEDENTKMFAFTYAGSSLLNRFSKLTYLHLLFTDSIRQWMYFYYPGGTKIPGIHLFLAKLMSKVGFLRKLARWVEIHFFPEKNKTARKYFDEFKPDLVFSTSIISTFDVMFMKEAKRRKIKTVSMPKSWDNITNGYYRFAPDYLLVPNEFSSEMIPRLQNIPKNRIFVVGIPQFDWYAKKEIFRTKEGHFKRKGLDPNRPLLFFGSAGAWAAHDPEIAEKIYEWIKNDELAKPCQLLIRPHFSNAHKDPFKNFKNKKKVIVDTYRLADIFGDKWDPSIAETIDFVNSVFHCDIMITIASTLSLDAACLDRPVINIGFGCEFNNKGEDITTAKYYSSEHMGWALSTSGIEKVNSFEELKDQINRYLSEPGIDAEGRKILRERLCYKVDGLSSRRMADAINKILAG